MTDREKICAAIDAANSNQRILENIAKLDISLEECSRALDIVNGYWCCSDDLKSIITTDQRLCTK